MLGTLNITITLHSQQFMIMTIITNRYIRTQELETEYWYFSINQDHPRNANPPNKNNNADLIILHQHIRGLYNKIAGLLYFWTTEFPHTLCFTEHHLCDHEINSTCIKYYKLGAKYCRKGCKYGGVSIFVHETLLFSTVELNEFCRVQDLEVCAVKLHISSFVLCILCVYRPPTGNFSYF